MSHPITHPEMVARLVKSGTTIKTELSEWDCSVIHAVFGICGELGELSGGIEFCQYNNELLDKENILEELGDLEFYLEDLRNKLQLTREQICSCETVCRVPNGLLRMSFHMWLYSNNIMDEVKKAVIYRKGINSEKILINLSKLEYILGAFYIAAGFTREQALEHNMNKLAIRYNGFNYSDQQAQQRADKPEEQKSSIIIPRPGIFPIR